MSSIQGHYVRFLLAVLLASIISFSANAQDYQQIKLEQAIDIALQHNLQKNISVQSLQIAEQQYQAARSAHWPKTSFQSVYQRTDQDLIFQLSRPSITIPGLPAMPPTTEKVKLLGTEMTTHAIKLELPLYTGGKISSIVNQAELAKAIAEQEIKRTNLQVVRDVKRYYLTVQMLQQLEDVAVRSVSMLKATQRITKAMMDGGSMTVNRLDYLKTEMASNYAEGILVDFRGKKQSAMAALANTMGLETTDTLSLSAETSKINIPKSDLQELIKQAQTFNPQLDMLRLSVKLAQEKISEEKSAYLPQVAMLANAMHFDSNLNTGLNNDANRNSWTIGLVANLTLFDGGMTKHRVAASQLALENTLQQQKLVEAGMATQLKALFIELDSASTRAEIANKNAELAKEHSQLSSSALDIGAITPEKTIEAHIYASMLAAEAVKTNYNQQEHWLEIEYLLGASINE